MSLPKILLQIGAYLCLPIGVLYTVAATHFVIDGSIYRGDALVTAIMAAYALIAFLPFVIFVFPKIKTPRTSVFYSVGLLEIFVLMIFVWSFLDMLRD
jgi:hypothetical protein